MNRDEVLALAREAAFHTRVMEGELLRFAALVAAHERNKIAAWMIARGYATGHGDTTEDLLTELEWQIKEREREACAKVCEDEGERIDASWMSCAAAIRSRT